MSPFSSPVFEIAQVGSQKRGHYLMLGNRIKQGKKMGTFSPIFRPYFLAPFSRHPSENVLISGTPILIFLCIFITASFPVSHTYFPPGEKNKKQPCRKIAQTVSWVKVNQLRVKKYTCQNGHIPLCPF